MSKSHKKPVIKHNNNKFYKKWFNRQIRRSETTHQGMSYKKANCTWDICDFNTGELTKEELEKYGEEKYKVTILLNSKERAIREIEKDSNETIIAGLKIIEDAYLLRDKYFDLIIDNVVFRTALKMACAYFLYPNSEDNKRLNKRLSIHNEHPQAKVNKTFKYFENKARNKCMVGEKDYGKKENR